MASFNLLDEKWIPCVMLDGQPEELGLSDVLINATSVREVLDQSPLVTIALHRLMLAVLHRNFGPSDIAAWKDLWRQGRWNADVLTDYFTECRNGFYLFHPVRPFYQVPRMVEVKELSPVTRLAAQIASGNNPTLFNHSFDGAVEPVPTAQAARWLLAFQGFSLGGGVSKPFNFSDAPLARGYTVLAVGANLFETLMLNLTPYGRSLPQGFRHLDEDLPAWEQKDPAAPERDGTQPNGYLDYLTWQSRRIWLQPEGDSAVVRWCQVQQNLKLAPGKLDQFMRFRKNKDEGYVQVKLEEERAVWRDSHALFQDVSTESLRPEFFNWLARIDRERKYGSITAQERYDLQVIGQGTPPGRANVVFWRHERLPLPLSYLDDKALEAALDQALIMTERVGALLGDGFELVEQNGKRWREPRPLREMAAALLAPGEGRTPDRNAVKEMVKHFTPAQQYWSQLESPFRKFLVDLVVDRQMNDDGDIVYGEVRLPEWYGRLRTAALSAFADAVLPVQGSHRTYKAAALADARFQRLLSYILG